VQQFIAGIPCPFKVIHQALNDRFYVFEEKTQQDQLPVLGQTRAQPIRTPNYDDEGDPGPKATNFVV
jgi:hypothetical protein